MFTITAPLPEVKREIATPESICADLSAKVDALVKRMKIALDAIAEENGAFHCENCGEWTLEQIEVFDYSEEMGEESHLACRRCA